MKLQEKNFSVEFAISRELDRSSNFSDIISKAKNLGLTVKLKVNPENYYYKIYGATQNSLYDALHGYISLLKDSKWYKHHNGERTILDFL